MGRPTTTALIWYFIPTHCLGPENAHSKSFAEFSAKLAHHSHCVSRIMNLLAAAEKACNLKPAKFPQSPGQQEPPERKLFKSLRIFSLR